MTMENPEGVAGALPSSSSVSQKVFFFVVVFWFFFSVLFFFFLFVLFPFIFISIVYSFVIYVYVYINTCLDLKKLISICLFVCLYFFFWVLVDVIRMQLWSLQRDLPFMACWVTL
uniref:Protein NRT1/ PTR FAMILY 5.4-like n=2 Tax=Rhizophora mucronata TaxID=61149 RepID=A0A2P2MTA9_RHIMU